MADYRAQRLARIRANYERFTAHSNPMTDNNLIPPPELVQQWHAEADNQLGPFYDYIATRAAKWGADRELEACCAWLLEEPLCASNTHRKLRDARRKPPSLKEQALALIDGCNDPDNDYLDDNALATIRRALEQLPE